MLLSEVRIPGFPNGIAGFIKHCFGPKFFSFLSSFKMTSLSLSLSPVPSLLPSLLPPLSPHRSVPLFHSFCVCICHGTHVVATEQIEDNLQEPVSLLPRSGSWVLGSQLWLYVLVTSLPTEPLYWPVFQFLTFTPLSFLSSTFIYIYV